MTSKWSAKRKTAGTQGHFPQRQVNLVDLAHFPFKQSLGKFSVSGFKTVLNFLALVSVAGIINAV